MEEPDDLQPIDEIDEIDEEEETEFATIGGGIDHRGGSSAPRWTACASSSRT